MARILIVDDDSDAALLFERWLQRRGYEVVRSSTGEGALKVLEQTPCDLVLLDVFLPGIGGYEVARRMCEDPDLNDVPVVMISISEKEDRPETPNIKEWLLKPFRANDLETTVARFIGGDPEDG